MRTPTLLLSLALTAGCYPKLDILSDLGELSEGSDGVDGADGGDGADGTDGTETCTVWTDADGDGYGAGEALRVPCDDLPADAVDNDLDCDDAEPSTYPGAAERCDGVDQDCDGVIDNDINSVWFADEDGDGWGDASGEIDDCDPPDGYVDRSGDCDDAVAITYPGADEVCDEADNDCDDEVDEDAVDAPTWYSDGDGDGYGRDDTTLVQCARPEAYVSRGGDCDDGTNTVHPDVQEICDLIDNDCDGDIDDADSSVDLSTGSTFYLDADADGWGADGSAFLACQGGTGTATVDGDCDDGDAAIQPDATEECDSIDNDCDGHIDDADADLDTSTGSTWYSDSDSDGYGDAGASAQTCLQPTGTVTDATDCDDTDGGINPAASEVCDGADNDCDGAIDDDDASLDTSTQSTWYADSDSDGEGDPSTTLDACSQPPGYVANDTDCDDTDATDTDGDGTQDCADDDIDGDGLRNAWDADEDDATIYRGPTGGLGGDGTYSLSSNTEQGDWTLASAALSAGTTSIAVDSASAFSVGDEVLVLSQQGTDAGGYQFVFVSAVSGSTLTIEPPLDRAYSGSSVVLVQRVPHYTTVAISGNLRAEPWAGAGGGVVVLRSTGAVSISGSVEAEGAGFEGGPAVAGNGSSTTQGDSYLDNGGYDAAANEGGGGAGYNSGVDACYCGGGGGYGSAGDNGSNRWNSTYYQPQGGASYGAARLTTWFLGSGGGGGGPDNERDGNGSSNVTGGGGAGGGIIALFSATSITVNGDINANGDDGEDASSNGAELGGGGAGSGGQILLAAPTLTLSGDVEAEGGDGGDADSSSGCSNSGGDGGNGRIQLLYTSASGNTSPTANTDAFAY